MCDIPASRHQPVQRMKFYSCKTVLPESASLPKYLAGFALVCWLFAHAIVPPGFMLAAKEKNAWYQLCYGDAAIAELLQHATSAHSGAHDSAHVHSDSQGHDGNKLLSPEFCPAAVFALALPESLPASDAEFTGPEPGQKPGKPFFPLPDLYTGSSTCARAPPATPMPQLAPSLSLQPA